MTKRFPIVLLSVLSLANMFAQAAPNTILPLDQTQMRATTATALPSPLLLAGIGGKLVYVQLGAGITLNTATNPPTLNYAVVQPIAAVETYPITTASSTLPLAFTPIASSVDCYRNGLVLSAGYDYTISGAVLTFIAGAQSNAPQPGDVFRVRYLH